MVKLEVAAYKPTDEVSVNTVSSISRRIAFVLPLNDPAIRAVVSADIADAEDAIVMSLDTFNSFVETFHLLKSPANASHLSKSIQQYQNGRTQEHELSND